MNDSKTIIQPKTNNNLQKDRKYISKSDKIKKSKIQIDLDKLRKSKEFRELGDMLYID